MKKLILGVVALLIATPAMAQVKSPIYIDRNGSYQGAQGTICINADATPCPAGTVTDPIFTSGGVPTGTAGTPNAAVVSVQGITNGTALQVNGNVASGTADGGAFPLKMGGYAGSTVPTTVTTGQRVNLWLGVNGQMVIGGTAFAGADAASNTLAQSTLTSGSSGLFAVSSFVYNGATWDRQRGDVAGTYVVSTPTATAANAITPVVTAAVAGSVVGKASAGNLYGVNVTSGASAGFVMVFNATSAPADGAVTPVKCLPVAANSGFEWNFRDMPVALSTGVTVVFSTTGCFLKTISATAFISVDAK